MTYPINSFNNNSQQSMGLGAETLDSKKIKTEIKNNNNIVTNTMDDHGDKEKMYVAGATFASWLGISKVMDKFNAKCKTVKVNGKDTSMLHKFQESADKLGHKIEDNAIGSKVFESVDKSTNIIKNKVINKNKILSSIFNTPMNPELAMPRMMKNGTLAETAQDTVEAIEKYCKNKNVSITSLGLTTPQFKEICKEPVKYIGNLIKICEKIPNEAIEVGSKTPILNKIFDRKVYPTELINKLNILSKKSIIGKTSDLSRLGKVAPKMFLRTVEGLTNGTAGGKLAIAFQAMCFGDAVVRTFKAPKGEKGKTFAESIINDLSFYLLMPLGLSMIYGAAGAKYIGMSKNQVNSYRVALNSLNERNAAKAITKAEYKKEVKHLKEMLKGDTKIFKNDKFSIKVKKAITNIVNLPVKKAGKILGFGLEKINPYRGKDASIFDKLKDSTRFITSKLKLRKGKGLTIKGFAGGSLRFASYMFFVAPFLSKQMTKISHVLFGKPTKSILDENTENKTVEQEQIIAYNSAKQVINESRANQLENVEKVKNVKNAENNNQAQFVRQNLLDKYRVNTNKQENVPQVNNTKRYIPSTEAVKVQVKPNPAVDAAYSQSFIAEKIAINKMSKQY